jgi:hypothetical protein
MERIKHNMIDRESMLPKWAQNIIAELRLDNETLTQQLKNTRAAAAITSHLPRDWFAIYGPRMNAEDDSCYSLWYFSRNSPVQMCTLYKNDVLLIGRANTGIGDAVIAQYEEKYNG